MDCPQRVTASMFNDLVDLWLREKCWMMGLRVLHSARCRAALKDGTRYMCLCSETETAYGCKECGSDILFRRAFISRHLAGWDHCVGLGEVINPTIPFCLKCEPNPNIYGCVHDDPQPITKPAPTQDVGFWRSLSQRLLAAISPEHWDM